jgi:general secretion pathway protein K
MTANRPATGQQQCQGAALLMAMLTVALVATLAASALWRQWRGVEVEAAERNREQALWILSGAQDWGRLILRQDAISGSVDHLAEPWSIPLAESRVSTFLSDGEGGQDDDDLNAFLSGQINDLQARLNVYQLIENQQISSTYLQAFRRLFDVLELPQAELDLMAEQLRLSLSQLSTQDGDYLIAPSRPQDLQRLGLSAATLMRLLPHISWLTAKTTVNLNTASLEVLYASLDGLDQSGARKIEQARLYSHFTRISQIHDALGLDSDEEQNRVVLNAQLHGINSSYFEIKGQVRIDDLVVAQTAVVQRSGRLVRTLRRERLPSYAALDQP